MKKRLTPLARRIREARTAAGLTQAAIGRACGNISPQAVKKWEHGESKPSAAALAEIANLTDRSLEWFVTGRVELPTTTPNHAETQGAIAGRVVPSLLWDDVIKHVTVASTAAPTSFARSHFPCSEKAFRTVIKDRSNEPQLSVGDSVIIDPAVPPEPGCIVLVILKGKELLLRKLRMHAGGVDLVPLNPDWKTVTVPDLDDTMVVGTLTEHCRPCR